MYGCNKTIIIKGGQGLVEMTRALQQYINDNYGGDCEACHDIFVGLWSVNEAVNNAWIPIEPTNATIES
eukprot:2138664-Karenia_brevis.AAC.1